MGWAFVAVLCTLAAAPAAQAAEVVVLGEDGRTRTVDDPFVPARPDFAQAPAPRASASAAKRRRGAVARQGEERTVPGELARLRDTGAIDPATHDQRLAVYDDARRRLKNLDGRRELELGAVLVNLERIAAAGQLTPSRLNALWLTLERNLEWWTQEDLLSNGTRVGFEGSDVVWQYYAGEGIQIQVLGTFGKLNALWRARRTSDERLHRFIDEMLLLAAERAGGLAWEYYFDFGGGAPPWASALAQGTGVQAMSRAATRVGRQPDVFPALQRALTIFEVPAPEGVRLALPGGGVHYLIYSFDPGLLVLNGFIQALVGLYDFSEASGDPRARALFDEGDRAARIQTGEYDTGAWSLYSLGRVSRESDLSYHRLVRDFLTELCKRTQALEYCEAEANFTAYLTEEPALRLRSRRLRGGKVGRLKYRISKVSRVGIEIRRAGRLVLSRTVSSAPYGTRYIEWDVPRRAGTYSVSFTAVDLAGNRGSASGTFKVLKPKKKKRTRRRP